MSGTVQTVNMTHLGGSSFRVDSPETDRWVEVVERDWPEDRPPTYLITRSDGIKAGGEMFTRDAFGYATDWIRSA
jgi:hypothetical protein